MTSSGQVGGTVSAERGSMSRLLVWAAPDEVAERSVRQSLRRWMSRCGDGFDRVADTWSQATPGTVRGAVVASSGSEAVQALDLERPGVVLGRAAAELAPVAMLLPGEGAQHHRMAVGIYEHDPVATEAIDEVLDLMGAEGSRVRADWLAETPLLSPHHPMRALPMVFAVDYALVKVLLAWGIRPGVLVGQGVGELAAAVLAGVMTLADAVDMLTAVAFELLAAPAGGALAVAAGAAEAAPHLDREVSLAADNGPGQIIVSGVDGALRRTEQSLRTVGISCMRVRAAAAYRSHVAVPACEAGMNVLRGKDLRAPSRPLLSTTTAAPVSAEEATDPAFWAYQPSRPVRLRETLNLLFAGGAYRCITAGPGQGLSSLVRRHIAVATGTSSVSSLLCARPRNADDDRRTVLAEAARLWAAGYPVDLDRVHRLA
jgi:acyl transferase domain-containing protein